METCDLCGGYLALLGQLGNRVHVVCQNCGMQFSHKAEEKESDEAESE